MKREPAFYHVSGENSWCRACARRVRARAREMDLPSLLWRAARLRSHGCRHHGPGANPQAPRFQCRQRSSAWSGRSFLDPLGPELVAKELHLGRVLHLDGQVVEGWSTFHGHHRVIVRGSKKGLTYRRCQACCRKVYFSLGLHYLCPAPPAEHQILTTDCGFVRRPELFSLLKIKGLEGRRKSLTVPEPGGARIS